MLDALITAIETLLKDEQHLSRDSLHMQLQVQTLAEYASQLKAPVQESRSHLDAIKLNVDVLKQDLVSLNERINDAQYVSYDGTFIWKITGFREKMSKWNYSL